MSVLSESNLCMYSFKLWLHSYLAVRILVTEQQYYDALLSSKCFIYVGSMVERSLSFGPEAGTNPGQESRLSPTPYRHIFTL